MRSNRETSIRLIEEYARQNSVELQRAGFDGTSRNLNLAHFLGPTGAISLLRADPTANAASILPSAAASNPEVFRRGSANVQDILDYAERRAQRGTASGRAQGDRVTALRAEAEAYDQATATAERLKSVQEQLDADREKGGELGKTFATAGELIKASSDKLTPALAAQRAEVLALAEARSKAAQSGLSSRFDTDQAEARAALGRTAAENAARTSARSYGFDVAADSGRAAQATLELNAALAEAKSTASSAFSGLASDLLRGTSAADALRNQLLRIADVILNKLSERLVSSLFGGLTGGSSSAPGLISWLGGGSFVGFDGGGYTGNGGRLEPAGIVHRGEYVIPADVVRRVGVAPLEALRRGYANGGLVGAPSIPSPAFSGPGAGSRVVTIAPTIHVNATGGTPAQNADLARQSAAEMTTALRGLVQRELAEQMRPGGMMNR